MAAREPIEAVGRELRRLLSACKKRGRARRLVASRRGKQRMVLREDVRAMHANGYHQPTIVNKSKEATR